MSEDNLIQFPGPGIPPIGTQDLLDLLLHFGATQSVRRRGLILQTARRLAVADASERGGHHRDVVELADHVAMHPIIALLAPRFAGATTGTGDNAERAGMDEGLKRELVGVLTPANGEPIDFEGAALKLHLSRITDPQERRLVILAAEALGLRANVTDDGENSEELRDMAQLLAEDRLVNLAKAVLPGWKLVKDE